jgi:hypothetical protein
MLGLLTAVGLAGCGASSADTKPPSPFPSPAPATVTYADNGQTVRLAVGRRALFKLVTLAWTFKPIAGSAVRASGAQRLVYVTKGCTAPNGCGYVELTVDAVARGRSVVAAERGSCGEAERCAPNRRKFAVTVIVH